MIKLQDEDDRRPSDVPLRSEPLFSVIIPAYNRGHLIRETLESVFRQDEASYEVIVVDDGSTDGTIGVMKEYGERIKLIQQENAGPGAARNRGAEEATGEYLAFLDSDDLWFPWTLAVYRTVLRKFDQPALVTSVPFSFQNELEAPATGPPEARCERFRDYFAASDEYRNFGSGLTLVRRDVFEQSGGFTVERVNAEDLDFILRIGDALGFVHVSAQPLVACRQHNCNLTNDVRRSAAGQFRIVAQEKADRYPGGAARRWERRKIITRSARSTVLASLRDGDSADAWRLYRLTFGWHVTLQRWKFIIGFPFVALRTAVCSAAERVVAVGRVKYAASGTG